MPDSPNPVYQFFTSPPVVAFLSAVLYRWGAAAVRNLPKPKDTERFYGWLYNTAQDAGANPDLKIKKEEKGA